MVRQPTISPSYLEQQQQLHTDPNYDLRSITPKVGLFSIACVPAKKLLADGRNAHLIQRPSSWWLPRLCEHFEIGRLQRSTEGFWVLVEPRTRAA